IAQPSRELKLLQRYLLGTKLASFQIHSAATGYVPNRNILHNAQAHQHHRIILKLDFENFFPSIRVADWDRYLRITKPASIERPDFGSVSKNSFLGSKNANSKMPIDRSSNITGTFKHITLRT